MYTTAALGFFDGVHIAHQHLLNAAADRAAELGISSIAVTFDRHPLKTITGSQPPLLCTAEERCAYIKTYTRIERVEELAFDEEMMNMAPRAFIEMLAEKYGIKAVFAGFDYTFGKNGEGKCELLQSICADMGIECRISGMESRDGVKISSSAIRELIKNGDTVRAAELLGRSYSFSGIIQHGKALGRTLGFPTINVPVPQEMALPKAGVYLCRVSVDGGTYNAVCNIAHGEKPLCEANIFDFSRDVYGKCARIELFEMLREMKNFESFEKLREQVEIDKKTARNHFRQGI